MKFSIAMCTYNGATHLQEQLDSIRAQTRLPDELVVCDDKSSDATRDILVAFKLEAPFPVRLYFNETNLGCTKNFEKAIGLCDGHLIALCDQDDVWHPEKLSLTEAEFIKSKQTGLVFTDLEICDESLQPLGYRAWEARWVEFATREQRLFKQGKALNLLLTRNVVTGTAMAFRSEFKNLILPLHQIQQNMLHDRWIALMISSVAVLTPIPKPLVKYRIHPNQHEGLGSSAPTATDRQDRARRREEHPIDHYLIGPILERLIVRSDEYSCEEAINQLQAHIAHAQARMDLVREKFTRRAGGVFKELMAARYHICQHPDSNAWREAATDLTPYKIRLLKTFVTRQVEHNASNRKS